MADILLIDDEDTFRRALSMVLTRAGHRVQEARDGAEAIKLYLQAVPDLVITDLIMPDKEGVETIIALRELNPSLRIIAMSGADACGDYLKIARKLGARRTFSKPFHGSEIIEGVESLLAAA
jgi:CheY-like chemotaxis protein